MGLLLGLLLVLIALSVPVAFALGITSYVYMVVNGLRLLPMPQRMVAGVDKFVFLSIPFFILAGNLMNTGGVTRRLFEFATELVGWIPGGLGHANVVASVIFAGMSGAAIADAGGLGTIEIRAMVDAGYDADFAAGISAASSTIGPIIPPSIPMVVYASLAGVSVGGLFLAGVIPGLLMGLSLMIIVYIIAKKRNYPVHDRLKLPELWVAFKKAFLPLITPLIILGGIIFGIFTPTEAAIIASTYALILGVFLYREIKPAELYDILLTTVNTTVIVVYIMAVASIFGWIMAREQVPQAAARFLLSLSDNPLVVLFIINIFLLIVGLFMETGAAQVILVPVLAPLIHELGIDPIHFGVVMVLNLMIGLITPPVGVCLYVIANVAGISFERTVRATAPFLIPLIIVLLLVTYVPQVTLFLPRLLLKF